MILLWVMLTGLLGSVIADAPVTYPGPVVPEVQYGAPREPQASYGPPQYTQPEKNFVPISYQAPDEGFGIEAGYQGFLVPALEAASAAVANTSPNPATTPNPLAALLSASSDILANTDLSSALLGGSSLFSKPWFWGIAPKIATGLLKSLASYLLKFVFVVLLGGGFTVAVCTFTPICTLSFLGFGFTQKSLRESMRTYVTQDRLTALTTYITEAIDHYRKLQQKKYKEKNFIFKKQKPLKKISSDAPEARITDDIILSSNDNSTTSGDSEALQNVHNTARKTLHEIGIPAEQAL